jgi:hypothetical protein
MDNKSYHTSNCWHDFSFKKENKYLIEMKASTIIFIFLIFFGFSKPTFAGDTLQLHKLVNRAFKGGEQLKYKVYYTASLLYVPAGEVQFDANLENYNSKICWHFKGSGRTYKSYDWFFRVKDLYESYVDTQTMLPIKFLRDVHEGSYKLYHNVTFMQEKHLAVSTKGVYKVPNGIQDIMSAVFSIRNVDCSNLVIGQKIPFNIFIDDEIWPIYIKYAGKEKIKTKVGTVNCMKFIPFLIKGNLFKGGEGMKIWITDDANKIPIRIESEVSVGYVRADLTEMTNIRSAFTSKIK